MALSDRDRIIRYHEARIRAYGIGSAMALGWNTKRNQNIRFSALTEIADLDHCSVLDIGCGKGDLRSFIGERFAETTYTGMEQVQAFVEMANKRYGHLPNTTFLQGDFCQLELPPADYVFASGSLNYKTSDKKFIAKIISRLFASAKKGLAFNLLSQTGYPPGDLCAYPPDEILAICLTLSTKVKLREDYLEGDFSVYIYR